MGRIQKKFSELRDLHRKAFIPFVTAGDPDLRTTEEAIAILGRAGADVIELGIPFSDPMADGPVIQKSSERALAAGTTLNQVLRLVERVRARSDIPLLLMGYYNPILAMGCEHFARQAGRAGVDAVLIVDLPPEEAGPLHRALRQEHIDQIFLLAPTSTAERIAKVARLASGFVYYVALTGITGAQLKVNRELDTHIAQIKTMTALPVCAGFGIKTVAQVARVARHADGVVIGSPLVQLIEAHQKNRSWRHKLYRYVDQLVGVLHG